MQCYEGKIILSGWQVSYNTTLSGVDSTRDAGFIENNGPALSAQAKYALSIAVEIS